MSEGSFHQRAKGEGIAQAAPGGTAIVNTTINKAYHAAPVKAVDPVTRKAALDKLGTLPLDHVPEPATLPSGSTMPWPSHKGFVGRQQDLKALATILRGEQVATIGQIMAATGMGGIGKTELASAFAHRYGQYFLGGVHWINLERADDVPTNIAKCWTDMVGSCGQDIVPLETQVGEVAGLWKNDLPRLLIFDNCEDEELLKAWRPSTGAARILVTSRCHQWSSSLGLDIHALGVLDRQESLELLLKHRSDLSVGDPDLDQIADRLGDLPLALHLAGSYLERYRFDPFGDPRSYLDELEKPYFLEHHSLIEGEASPTDHEQHVGQTFGLSYKRLDRRDEADGLALDLLGRASCFAPGQPIPRALLLASAGEGIEAKASADALARLLSLGLLQQEQDGQLVLHRLLVLFVQHEIDDLAVAQTAVEEVVRAEADKINQSGLPGPLLAWQGHLRHVAEVAARRQSQATGKLFSTLGYHLQDIADYADAKTNYERALEIDQNTFGPDHPDVAIRLNNLGLVLKGQGDLNGAKTNLEHALEIDQNTFGPDHPNAATLLSNLGMVLKDQGDLDGAKTNFQRALEIGLATLGPDHPNVAIRLNNLGMVLKDQGDLDGAKTNFQRALEIGLATLGPDHPNVAIRLNNLGMVLKDQGDLDGAKTNLERSLEIDQNTFGPDHPNVARGLNNLGMVLKDQGDLDGAKTNLERALRILEGALGVDHPSTQKVRDNLAGLA